MAETMAFDQEPSEGLAPSSFLATSEVPRCLGVDGKSLVPKSFPRDPS
jgi:hypothetical protein